MTSSLRMRVILSTVGAMSCLLAVSGVSLYVLLNRAMLTTVDDSLFAAAQLLAPLVEYEDGSVDLDIDNLPERTTGTQNLVELWTDDGKEVERSVALGNHDLPRFGGTLDAGELRRVTLPNGVPARAVGVRFTVQRDDEDTSPLGVTLVVARPMVELNRQLTRMKWALVYSFAGIIAAVSGVGLLVIGRGLRPLRRLTQQVESIGHESLSTRLEESGQPDEIASISRGVNGLLSRVQAAFERERGFASDVAHELRTPLAGAQSIIEVTLGQRREAAVYIEALERLRVIVRDQETMVVALLALARMEAGIIHVESSAVNLADAIRDAWNPWDTAAKEHALQVTRNVPQELELRTDRQLLNLVLSNVLGNAAEYCDRGGSIAIEATATRKQVIIRVSNSGCEMNPADANKAFDRYWRGDASRHGTATHSGLGLALVQRAVKLIGGRVDARISTDQRFTLTIEFPTSLP